jgi:hypothetical protein
MLSGFYNVNGAIATAAPRCCAHKSRIVAPGLRGWVMPVTFESDFWWDAVTQTIKFYAHYESRRIHCAVSRPALEDFAKSLGLSHLDPVRVYREHRREIELKAANKIRAGLFENEEKIFVKIADFHR